MTVPDWLLDCVTDQNFILVGQIGPDTRSGKKYELMATQNSFNIDLSRSVPLADPP